MFVVAGRGAQRMWQELNNYPGNGIFKWPFFFLLRSVSAVSNKIQNKKNEKSVANLSII
jgi:hypothetical protein